MKIAIYYAFTAIVLLCNLAAPLAADELRDAVTAYSNGDYATALRIWQPLAKNGNAVAQKCLGRMYDTGRGVTQDGVEAANWYRKAAEQGNGFAQFMMGLIARNGAGAPQDHNEAMKWFRLVGGEYYLPSMFYTRPDGTQYKMPDNTPYKGIVVARFLIGMMYLNGEGVPKDLSEAAKWLQSVADLGPAQNDFGQLVRSESAVGIQDANELYAWYGKAVSQNYDVAMKALGLMYANGAGVPKNSDKAIHHLQWSAAKGDAMAQYNLGLLFNGGVGNLVSKTEAYKWFSLAAQAGDAAAARKRDEVVKSMSSAELQLGNRVLDTWYSVKRSQEFLPKPQP